MDRGKACVYSSPLGSSRFLFMRSLGWKDKGGRQEKWGEGGEEILTLKQESQGLIQPKRELREGGVRWEALSTPVPCI